MIEKNIEKNSVKFCYFQSERSHGHGKCFDCSNENIMREKCPYTLGNVTKKLEDGDIKYVIEKSGNLKGCEGFFALKPVINYFKEMEKNQNIKPA